MTEENILNEDNVESKPIPSKVIRRGKKAMKVVKADLEEDNEPKQKEEKWKILIDIKHPQTRNYIRKYADAYNHSFSSATLRMLELAAKADVLKNNIEYRVPKSVLKARALIAEWDKLRKKGI